MPKNALRSLKAARHALIAAYRQAGVPSLPVGRRREQLAEWAGEINEEGAV